MKPYQFFGILTAIFAAAALLELHALLFLILLLVLNLGLTWVFALPFEYKDTAKDYLPLVQALDRGEKLEVWVNVYPNPVAYLSEDAAKRSAYPLALRVAVHCKEVE